MESTGAAAGSAGSIPACSKVALLHLILVQRLRLRIVTPYRGYAITPPPPPLVFNRTTPPLLPAPAQLKGLDQWM